MKKNKAMIVTFLAPALFMFIMVFLYPICRTVVMSFFKIEGITDSFSKWQFTGIDNYVKLMNTTLFKTSMWNLFRIWFIGGIIVMSLALLLRYPHQRNPFQEFFQSYDLPAERGQCGGSGDDVAPVCVQ